MSRPLPLLRVSAPSPPSMMPGPLPPVILSLPAPPYSTRGMLSCGSTVMVSLPSRPSTMTAPVGAKVPREALFTLTWTLLPAFKIWMASLPPLPRTSRSFLPLSHGSATIWTDGAGVGVLVGVLVFVAVGVLLGVLVFVAVGVVVGVLVGGIG